MHRWTSRTAVLGGVLGLALTAIPAGASMYDVDDRGQCTVHADWRLKAQPDDGRIRVEGEVDSDRSGRSWKWKIFHDGAVSYHGRAKTDGGGSFKVERRVVDAPGYDVVGWRARNARSGERCRGHVTL